MAQEIQHLTQEELEEDERRLVEQERSDIGALLQHNVQTSQSEDQLDGDLLQSAGPDTADGLAVQHPVATEDQSLPLLNDAFDHKFCFIAAQSPIILSTGLEKRVTSDRENVDQRNFEINHFIELFHLTKEAREEQIRKENVISKEDLKIKIQRFLRDHTTKAITAWIFFNGRGTENGLQFLDDSEMALDDFLGYVRSVFLEEKKKYMLPCRVQVVFMQSYGHRFSPDSANRDELYVHSLSSEDAPTTVSMVRVLSLGASILDSHHVQLEEFAEKLNKITDPDEQDKAESQPKEGEESDGEKSKVQKENEQERVEIEGNDDYEVRISPENVEEKKCCVLRKVCCCVCWCCKCNQGNTETEESERQPLLGDTTKH